MDSTFKSHVKLGNGALVEAKGKGTIGVQTNDGSRFIRDVLLVPELDQNLLSVGQLLEHGYKLDFLGDGCIIYDKGKPRKVVKKIKMQSNRSFPFTLKYMKSIALKVEIKDESWLWHRRLGHLNFQGLKLLSQKGMVQEQANIPIKTKVIINGWAIGRDPEYWSDAECFEPGRHDGSSVNYRRSNFQFIPFGAGRRICQGMALTIVNIELPLARLLYHFDWKLANGVQLEELDMTEAFGVTVRRKNDLQLIATPYIPAFDY
ncbi:hypothetical protein RJ639_008602 [Escallonia herrerae]|uniref:Cytochrome P450 n=1 Tax=Escallonia herrerae TaxID=1293975 RepID=A0AA88VRE7_9ASTE|nr:hypothetical protein RJ639_008602 [Escallonia herrerae]